MPVWRASARQQSDKYSAAPEWRTTALGSNSHPGSFWLARYARQTGTEAGATQIGVRDLHVDALQVAG